MDYRKLAAEVAGTFMLVSAVCGSALFSAAFPAVGSGILGVAFAVGLSVTVMAYAVGHISGGHFNPAVTFGFWMSGRFPANDILPYIAAQVMGGAAAAGVFYLVATGKSGFVAGDFASNGYGPHSPGNFSVSAVFLTEVVLTALFLMVIIGSTSKAAASGFAPLAIGLALTVFHLMAIPVSNASLNPARSLATALYADSWALKQVWIFWAAPIMGAAIGGFASRWLQEEN